MELDQAVEALGLALARFFEQYFDGSAVGKIYEDSSPCTGGGKIRIGSRPLSELLKHVLVDGAGYAMVLPQPGEYSEGENGDTHPFRLTAPLFPLDRNANVDLRLTASIDRYFLRRDTRVTALSRAAWLALADRLSRYFVGAPLDVTVFGIAQGSLHPDAK